MRNLWTPIGIVLLLQLLVAGGAFYTGSLESFLGACWLGVQDGVELVGTSLLNLLVHPVLSFKGVESALEGWRLSFDALTSEWRHYYRAALIDSIVFVESTATLLSVLAAVVMGTQFLEGLRGAASRWGLRREEALVRTSRVSLMRWLRRRGGLLREVVVLARARSLLSERRLGVQEQGFRWLKWRLRCLLRDVSSGIGVAGLRPLPVALYWMLLLLSAVVGMIRGIVSAMLRYAVLLVLPVPILLQLWIDDELRTEAIVTQHHARIVEAVKALLHDVEGVSSTELRTSIERVQSRYEAYRVALLGGVQAEDERLELALAELNASVEVDVLADAIVDFRLEAAFSRYARRRLYLTEEVFLRHKGELHSSTAPSRNWLVSLEDEAQVFLEAAQRAKAGEVASLLQEFADRLRRRRLYEACIAGWDPTVLLERPLAARPSECGSLESPDTMGRRLE